MTAEPVWITHSPPSGGTVVLPPSNPAVHLERWYFLKRLRPAERLEVIVIDEHGRRAVTVDTTGVDGWACSGCGVCGAVCAVVP